MLQLLKSTAMSRYWLFSEHADHNDPYNNIVQLNTTM